MDVLTTQGWLGVVSAAHVRRGADLGIAQINHGRRGALARMHAGDTLIYYSPTEDRGDRTPYQCFTALGVLPDDEIWQADEGAFTPYRRHLSYLSTRPVPLAELRPRLHLTADRHWGHQLRRGLVALDEHDVETIREAMQA